MKKFAFILTFGLLMSTALCAQNPTDSALIVTEMVGEQEAANDTISDSTWVFDSYGTTSAVDDWDDDDLEEFIVRLAKKYFDGNPETLENEFQQFEKFGKLIRFAVVFCFIVLPLLILALILFSVYKGRQAKRREYERRESAKATAEQPASEQPAAESAPYGHEYAPADDPMAEENRRLRNDGIKNVCVGVGLAILLGIIMKGVGLGIGALVAAIGLGKLIIWYLDKK